MENGPRIERQETDDKLSFEDLLNQDKFHQDIESLSQAIAFKKFLEERWDFICDLERQAENNYRSEPRLKEYIALTDAAYEIDQFVWNNLDINSEEAKIKQKEQQDLEDRAKALLDQNHELKTLEDGLSDIWKGTTNSREDFLRETNILRKIKVIDKVLIPYFEQQEEAYYFENVKPQELNKTRDELYSLLDQDPANQDLESRIKAIEEEIGGLPNKIALKNRKFELMKNNLDEAVRKAMSSFD